MPSSLADHPATVAAVDGSGPAPADALGSVLAKLGDVLVVRAADLRQLIRAHRRLLGFEIPHDDTLVVARAELVRLAEQEGLELEPPPGADPVLVVAEPSANERSSVPNWALERLLLARALHVRADAALAGLRADGRLDEARAWSLLEKLDLAAVREAVQVLEDAARLEPEASAATRLGELVATALELRHTTDGHLGLWFPTLDPARLDALLAELDVPLDAPALLGEEGAVRVAELARLPTREQASTDFEAEPDEPTVPAPWREPSSATLARRLARALPEADAAELDWRRLLAPLEPKRRIRREERSRRRLLRHLDGLPRALEEPGLRLRPGRWLARRGLLLETLTAQAPIRAYRRLKRARAHADQLGAAAQPLAAHLARACDSQRRALRERYREVLRELLVEGGLTAVNVPEEVAAGAIVEELLDALLDRDYLGFAHLRDAVSHNRLKLRDTTPASLLGGDPLLRVDRKLAHGLAGIYRPSTAYMRVLQRISALGFGTAPGRLLTRFALLPFTGAFVLLEALQHLVGPLASALGLGHPELVRGPVVAGVGLIVLLLLEHRPSRRAAWAGLRRLGRGLRFTFVDLPRRVVAVEVFRDLANNYVVALARRFILRPLLFVLLVWVVLRAYDLPQALPWTVWVTLFVAASAALNTRLGRRLTTDVSDTLGGWWGQLTRRVLPELFHLIVRTSRRVLDALEKVVFHVEELLRLRARHGPAAKLLRALAGRAWAGVAYLVRAYVALLIEPQLNPVKHFPVVTVSHKVMIPAIPTIFRALETVLVPLLGGVVGGALAGATVFLLPGLFGFVVWELSSNWRLFAANRPPTLQPVRLGPHGEDLLGLLRPGFRSGAIPRQVEKMRAEARRGWERGEHPDLTEARHHLIEIEERVRLFAERELAELLARAGVLEGLAVQVVQLGRYRCGLLLGVSGEDPLGLWLEERDGTLVATLRRPGFARRQPPAVQAALADALTGLLLMARVDRVEAPEPDGRLEMSRLRGTRLGWSDWVERWSRASRDEASPRFPASALLARALL